MKDELKEELKWRKKEIKRIETEIRELKKFILKQCEEWKIDPEDLDPPLKKPKLKKKKRKLKLVVNNV